MVQQISHLRKVHVHQLNRTNILFGCGDVFYLSLCLFIFPLMDFSCDSLFYPAYFRQVPLSAGWCIFWCRLMFMLELCHGALKCALIVLMDLVYGMS